MYILCNFFPISLWFNATVAECWKHLPSSIIGLIFAFLFFFLSNLENLYIHHVPNLFYYIDNATKWLKIKLQHFIDVSNPIWYLFRSDSKSSFIKFFFILKHDFYVITIWMHYTLFISVFRKAKVSMCQIFQNYLCLSSMD